MTGLFCNKETNLDSRKEGTSEVRGAVTSGNANSTADQGIRLRLQLSANNAVLNALESRFSRAPRAAWHSPSSAQPCLRNHTLCPKPLHLPFSIQLLHHQGFCGVSARLCPPNCKSTPQTPAPGPPPSKPFGGAPLCFSPLTPSSRPLFTI